MINLFFISLLGILSVGVFFLKNLFFAWCMLELYGVVYLLFIFLIRKKESSLEFYIYFGLINLFISVILILSILCDFTLISFMSVMSKMGVFPLVDWVVKFILGLGWLESWLFFSLNKVIPLFFIFEFLDYNLFIILLLFFFNFFISVKGCLLSSSVIELIIWSSMGSTGFFILSGGGVKDLWVWVYILIIYSVISFFSFYLIFSLKKKFLFLMILLLFGFPPFSMFLFKIQLLSIFFSFFSIFWFYFFMVMFLLFGFSYFLVFFKGAQDLKGFNFSLNMKSGFFYIFYILVVIFILVFLISF